MRCASFILLFWLLGASGALAAGCQQQPVMSEQEKADIRDSLTQRPTQTVVQPKSAVLIEGPAPLLYMAQEAGTLHITDAGTGAWLATANVSRGTVVRVDPDSGVYVGEQLLRPGPLAAGHRFSVVMDLNPQTQWQSRIEAPRPAPPPATKPANERIEPSF